MRVALVVIRLRRVVLPGSLHSLAALVMFAGCLSADGATSSAAAFGLLSPAQVRLLRAEANSSLGRSAVEDANQHISDTPHAVARLHTEGTLPHQGIRDQSIEAEQDFQVMADLGFAYCFTGERRYLDAEARYFAAWSSTYQPSFNPIDETRLDTVFIAFDLTRDALPPAVRDQTLAFFRTLATGYLAWWDGNAQKDPANWSSHRVKLMTLGAFETNDPSLIRRAGAAFQSQVAQNVKADGEVVDFRKRDALHYVTYDLEPLVTAALAAKMHGEDWFHSAPSGRPSLQPAIDWLLPYALGQKSHEEFVHSSVPFDAARAKAGEHGYSGPWHRGASVQLLALATWMDSRYTTDLHAAEQATGAQPSSWLQLCLNAESENEVTRSLRLQ